MAREDAAAPPAVTGYSVAPMGADRDLYEDAPILLRPGGGADELLLVALAPDLRTDLIVGHMAARSQVSLLIVRAVVAEP